jgi:hypothetical protein
MLDSPEGICAGQVWFENPATFVPFSKQQSTIVDDGQQRSVAGVTGLRQRPLATARQ